jgi:hypothetical protein
MTNDQTRDVDLWCVADRLRAHPGFMAGWCAARPGAFQVLVDELGLDEVNASRLMVCGVPRVHRYDQDVAAIAEAIGVETPLLAAAITTAATVSGPRTS